MKPQDLVLDQEQDEQRANALREAIDSDIDERLGLLLEIVGQRQEQDLARGLVDGVAERRVDDARERREPEQRR